MENLEVKNEMVESTTKKSKGIIVGLVATAVAVVGTLIYKRRKRNKEEVVEIIEKETEVFDVIDEELK